jgi:hypothetical protein
MTIAQALATISTYPIPALTIEVTGLERGLTVSATADGAVLLSKEYKLAKADLYLYLYGAPDLKEQDSAVTQADRAVYLRLANAIYAEYGDAKLSSRKVGFVGENFLS